MKKISYLGPKGTYSHEVCNRYINEKEYISIACNSINCTIELLVKDEVDECIVPIENSIRGTVLETLDNIINIDEITIIKEITLDIEHYLLSNKNYKKEDIKTIYSHTQALGQCKKYISDNFSNVKLCEVESTAKAAQLVKTIPNSMCISNKICSEIYDLKIIDKGIQDSKNNQTKFIVLSKKNNYSDILNTKISIMFSTNNTPGALYKILELFYNYNINMTKIESHPSKTKLGDYWFWVDIEGNIKEDKIKLVLDKMNNSCSYFKILGMY